MGVKGIVRHPAAVIIFSVITCFIYYLYWIYSFGNEMKMYLGKEDLNPGLDLLLCIICFPYTIYWSYKTGKLLTEAQEKAGLKASDDSILYLVLTILGLGVVAAAIMQVNANTIWQAN